MWFGSETGFLYKYNKTDKLLLICSKNNSKSVIKVSPFETLLPGRRRRSRAHLVGDHSSSSSSSSATIHRERALFIKTMEKPELPLCRLILQSYVICHLAKYNTSFPSHDCLGGEIWKCFQISTDSGFRFSWVQHILLGRACFGAENIGAPK